MKYQIKKTLVWFGVALILYITIQIAWMIVTFIFGQIINSPIKELFVFAFSLFVTYKDFMKPLTSGREK